MGTQLKSQFIDEFNADGLTAISQKLRLVFLDIRQSITNLTEKLESAVSDLVNSGVPEAESMGAHLQSTQIAGSMIKASISRSTTKTD